MVQMEKLKLGYKTIGLLLVIIAVIVAVVTISFTQNILVLYQEIHKSCPLPPETCPFKTGSFLPLQSVVGFVLAAFVGGIGIFITLTSHRLEKLSGTKTAKLREIVSKLRGDEKIVYDVITKSDGTIFQSDLIAKTGFSKVRISRILDRLETKDIIERRRRGMANYVVLKYQD